jgi:hypothetical protein
VVEIDGGIDCDDACEMLFGVELGRGRGVVEAWLPFCVRLWLIRRRSLVGG